MNHDEQTEQLPIGDLPITGRRPVSPPLLRQLREDWARLGTQDDWEEMVFSLTVVVAVFLFLGCFTEFMLIFHG